MLDSEHLKQGPKGITSRPLWLKIDKGSFKKLPFIPKIIFLFTLDVDDDK